MRRNKSTLSEPNYLGIADIIAVLFAIFMIAYILSQFLAEKEKAAISEGQLQMTYELRDNILFDSGSAVVRSEGISSLVTLAQDSLLTNYRFVNDDVIILVQGFTDDRPINTPEFPSNWELSSQRAVNVVKLLIEEGGIPPSRVASAGFGEFFPEYSNDTEVGRANNRKIKFTIIDKEALRILQ